MFGSPAMFGDTARAINGPFVRYNLAING